MLFWENVTSVQPQPIILHFDVLWNKTMIHCVYLPDAAILLVSDRDRDVGRYFIYDYYYVPKLTYYILLYIIIIL